MSLTELLCLGVRGQAQENESTSLPNTERTEELGGAVITGRGKQKVYWPTSFSGKSPVGNEVRAGVGMKAF